MRHIGDGRTRILLYFLLGIALPSGLLGYLAFRGIQNERALVERERRTELEALADRIEAAVESRLVELEHTVSASPPERLKELVEECPAIRAVFTTDSARSVRVVAAEGLLFGRDPVAGKDTKADRPPPLLRSARRRELGTGDPEGALELYRRALEEPQVDQVRAEALSGVARIQRKLDRRSAATESYERLGSDLGHVRSSVGVPFAAAAALELATLHLERGDTVRAVHSALGLYTDLVRGRWILTPARFDLLASAGRKMLEPLAAAQVTPGLADTVASLSTREGRQRTEAMALRGFEESAGQLFLRAGREERTVRGSVDVGTRIYPAVLFHSSPDSAGSPHRGVIVNAAGLTREAVSAVIGSEAERFSWRLRTPGTETAEASGSPTGSDTPVVSTSLGGFTPWTLLVSHSRQAVEENLLTSRRAIYLYAFILIAGILVSGLVFTLRTVGRELELARMKSDFVSTVSHEFKSPLTAIRQLAEMLRAGRVRSDERRHRYYEVLLEQSERLTMLVDNVLDVARMEAGRRELSPEPVDPASLVEETVADARQRVAHENFTIRTDLSEPLPTTPLDRDAFRQALGNLIDNGVKYSGGARELVVRGYLQNGSVVVAVEDFGIGMAPEEAARVFERFYRAGDEMTRTVKGTGLGLTLVKQIVDAHGGDVEVRSEPGQGSVFAMRFPATGATPATGSAPASDDDPEG